MRHTYSISIILFTIIFITHIFSLIFYRSFRELTPVEFACETMENVAKELHELIDQYRADPKRNINPFSMRLQGIIDANVMGMLRKFVFLFKSN